MWVPGINQTDKPRILLIGDSITEAYSAVVEKELAGEAYVAKLTTSKSLGDPAYLDEVAMVLGNTRFAVIHFNNGMHGAAYSETEYEHDYPKLLKLLEARGQGAKLICATTTPKRVSNQVENLDPFTERIRVRNEVAKKAAHEKAIALDDLFALVENHPEFYSKDGTHFNDTGVQAEGTQVAAKIRSALKPGSGR
jgi:lysophospholipase L1-like esterase